MHLSWLHLSDLHRCSARDGDHGDLILRRLLKDLKRLRDEHRLQPDFLFMTGDLAFGQLSSLSLAKQLNEGWTFLNDVRKVYDPPIPLDNVFLVPGNHDVDRNKIEEPIQYWLDGLAKEYNAGKVRQLIQNTGASWRNCMARLADYETFVARELPHIKDKNGRCVYSVIREIEGLKIGIGGFNSAWSAGTKEDKGKLWISDWQVDHLAEKLADVDVRIALIHHPISWYVENDAKLLQRFETEFHVLLHGHEHQMWVQTPQNDHLGIAAGATLDGADAVLGYNVARFDLETGQGEIFLRCLDQKTKKWKADIVPDRANNGTWPITAPWGHLAKGNKDNKGGKGKGRGKDQAQQANSSEHQSNEVNLTLAQASESVQELARASFGSADVQAYGDVIDFGPSSSLLALATHGDEFLTRVETITKIRHKNAKIQRHEGPDVPVPFLDIIEEDSGVISNYVVGAWRGRAEQALDDFLKTHHEFRQRDPSVRSTLVYDTDIASDELIRRAASERVFLKSFVEYQGLIDFRSYLQKQTQRLAENKEYNPKSYVDQSVLYHFGVYERTGDNAYDIVEDWLHEERGRFILVLGNFGTGKTFLLRELARRLGEDGRIIPVLIELRSLEKAHDFNILIAQHLAGYTMDVELEKFRYMLQEGRVVLLFDGFDELVTRVTYDRAMEHFNTLIQAAQGNAKVVVSSRTQHFLTDAQVKTVLGQRVDALTGNRIANLQPFGPQQVEQFLTHQLNDKNLVAERVRLLNEVRDLMGLSENPRMLGFISQLNEEELRSARSDDGEVTAASLYETLINRWLGFEVQRQEPRGATLALNRKQRLNAVTELALCLWERTEPCMELSELSEKVRNSIEFLADQRMSAEEATHQIGSGTLLVRDEDGRFSLIHQSVLEWLVARKAADEPDVLRRGKMTRLMAEFFRDLIGRDEARRWVHEALASEDERSVENALIVRERLSVQQEALRLVDQDLRGRDFSRQPLDGAVFDGSDLTGVTFFKASLVKASFKNAKLIGANFNKANLQLTDLSHANLARASFLGTERSQIQMEGAKLYRTKILKEGSVSFPNHSFASGALCVAWSPDGDLLVSGHQGGNIHLWDIETGQEIGSLSGHQNDVWGVCFSPDGKTLASASEDNTVRLWDPQAARHQATLEGHQLGVRSVCFSPDGKTLASASSDNTVRLWDPQAAQHMAILEGHQLGVYGVCFSPDGKTLASASLDKTVRLWDPQAAQHQAILEGHQHWVLGVCFSPDGKTLASASQDRTVRLWDPQAAQYQAILEGHQGVVESVCFSPDGKTLASASADKTVRLWDPQSAQHQAILEGHQNGVLGVCFSPDGKILASASADKTVRLWDPQSAQHMAILEGHQGGVQSVCFSPDGKTLASASRDKTVRLWDPQGAQHMATLEGHQHWVQSVCFSPDGKTLASASHDNTVRLWDPQAAQPQAILQGHQLGVQSVSFSPDGKTLASASLDNTVRLWDVKTQRCLAVLVHLPDGWVAYTPEGRYKTGGDVTGSFWHRIGLCRYEVGELDPYWRFEDGSSLRVAEGEPLFS